MQRSTRNKEKRAVSPNGTELHPGDSVRAYWGADGNFYDATILEVRHKTDTVKVLFTDDGVESLMRSTKIRTKPRDSAKLLNKPEDVQVKLLNITVFECEVNSKEVITEEVTSELLHAPLEDSILSTILKSEESSISDGYVVPEYVPSNIPSMVCKFEESPLYDSDDDPEYVPSSHSNKRRSFSEVLSESSSSSSDEMGKKITKPGKNSKGIKLPASLRGKNIYDKKFKCLYCDTFVSKLARHLERKHKKEDLVIDYLQKTKPGSGERKKAIAKIRKKSHYAHNKKVIEKGVGDFLVERRISATMHGVADYRPCPDCLGFYHRKSIAGHATNCGSKNTSMSTVKAFYCAFTSKECGKDQFTTVICSMSVDEIGELAKSDSLLLKFGRELYESLECKNPTYVSTKMREVSRMLLQMRKKFPALTMRDVITQCKFDEVIEATKLVCGIEPGKKLQSTPSLALKIGHTMKKLAAMVLNEAIRSGDDHGRKQSKFYLQLHHTEWQRKISWYALDALGVKKKAKALPLTSDLKKIRVYLLESINDLLEQEVTKEVYNSLVTAVLGRLILFNAKRGGEAGRMLIEDYKNILNAPHRDLNLTSLEVKLCSRLRLIKIMGKKGRRVPVLLCEDMINGIDHILAHRKKFISEKNPHIFLRANQTKPLSGWVAIKRITSNLPDLEAPESVTTTNVRKFVATVSQVMDLRGNELEWLANHMGHDLSVHKNFYRLPENTIQTAKVGKLLMALEKGIHKYAGKSLDDITEISDIEDNDEDDQDTGENLEDMYSQEDEEGLEDEGGQVDRHCQEKDFQEGDDSKIASVRKNDRKVRKERKLKKKQKGNRL